MADDLLSSKAESKAIVVVTNPCTKLVTYVQNLTGKPSYGMGVENDNIRFHRAIGSRDFFLLGAHNFYELAVASHPEALQGEFHFTKDNYKEITSTQDELIADGSMDALVEYTSALPPQYRWYGSQRLHSKYNTVANSCAAAMFNAFTLIVGKTKDPVSLETIIKIELSGPFFTCGWPFDPKTKQPLPMYISDKQHDALSNIGKTYGLKPDAVIFDLSSTLVNSQELDREALNHVLLKYGLPPWKEMRKTRDPSKSIKENFPNFFGESSDKHIATI